jgi:diaminobutyrate-2-oxoglutarate transaminase
MYHFESSVATYCRAFPANFTKAKGGHLYDGEGHDYLDFLSGCGSLNYGHNDDRLQDALVDYIRTDGIAMSLDLHTDAKQQFCETFENVILKPRGMDYKFMFTGPTGTNAVEAALKIARKTTGRRNVVAFTNAFHGCSLGALALTGSSSHRGDYNPIGDGVTRLPYDGYLSSPFDTADYLASLLADPSSGVDAPAAIILETIQGEGGLNTASQSWLRKIQAIAKQYGALLVIDDIQAGCGRSGTFFSFEDMGVRPDIILMAKALSGFGLPMSLVLLNPEVDNLSPGEHNGTFRGNCHAFVTATKALETFWADDIFVAELGEKIAYLTAELDQIATLNGLTRKGRGMMQGVAFTDPADSLEVRAKCYDQGLIVECCGPHDEVLKLLPPLTVTKGELGRAIGIITDAVQDVLHFNIDEVA